MSVPKKILVADDDAAIRTVLNQALARAGYEVRSTGNAATLWRWAAEGEGDLIVTDVMLPDSNIFDILPRIKKFRPELPIVVMSAQNTIMTAITAAERGAYEYLPKPFDLNELVDVVGRGLEQLAARQAAPATSDASEQVLPIIGRSAAMQDIYRIIARLTQTDLTVMIMGESGTGKELVAKALHDYGKRKNRPFVALNMAAIPRDLIESELFGHEKGAFTGAGARYAGRFEQASGGTLFLDEIGDMPMEAQTRLLRVLQEGTFTTVGGSRSIKADVRIIAATHRDLDRLIQQGLFREDLYFRLNVVPLRLPPLRERSEDIPDLVRHFLAVCEAEGLPARFLDNAAMDRLKGYRWPGNVRELENLVRRLSAIQADERITEESVVHALSPGKLSFDEAGSNAANSSLGEFTESYLADYFSQYGGEIPPTGLYDRVIKEVEEPLINAALSAVNGNQLRASELLGINRNTLRKKMKEHQIRAVRIPGFASTAS
ncbi:MAG: nitrogen regulation protein NR(I) [Pseudomonadota bacterium]